MSKHTGWSALGLTYYKSLYVVRLDFFGCMIYARAGQCRTLLGISWVVEE